MAALATKDDYVAELLAVLMRVMTANWRLGLYCRSATYIHLCSITDDLYAYVKYYGSHVHRLRAAMIGQRHAFDHGCDVVFTGEMCR